MATYRLQHRTSPPRTTPTRITSTSTPRLLASAFPPEVKHLAEAGGSPFGPLPTQHDEGSIRGGATALSVAVRSQKEREMAMAVAEGGVTQPDQYATDGDTERRA
ncbi:hypothetical protein BCV69DRAFT_283226 [Microstroma glucosiphilum]|uniref:Uncharacterized protein n=1 Tax=Pseudomicrostroma glucosiphilum TaxID=1684307 RepID=A0A316UBF6_9BASI|nr:hypothetical protein BCV69DRAFT_283226 [Pseudomicrostroma glucosiphilum]PWN20355.1 hypothetical protein BCV69DRAFT_283226 [Pseudomicrostroma glucosiphilum]